MRLAFLALLSNDVPVAARFWREARLLPQTYYDESIGYAAFETGNPGVTLSIVSRAILPALTGKATQEQASTARQMYLSFLVDAVDTTYAQVINQGARPISQPTDHPERQSRLAHFSDPADNLIEIYQPLRPAGESAE